MTAISDIGWAILLLLFVTVQRGGEILYADYNTRRLRAAGATEVGAGHYPLFVLLHGGWLLALWCWVLTADITFHPWPAWTYLALQGLRLWILASLGRFWTTRVMILPEAPLIGHGPYRFCRHPNYLLVALEIALLPLALGVWPLAFAFSVANALLVAWRIRVEEAALAPRRSRSIA
jgi:methyltransferase